MELEPGGALQLGHNCIPAPLLQTHARMQPVIHRYVCKYIYIYIAWLRKSGTLFGFLIWTLLYWGSGPYIFYQSIYRPTYLSMHLTTNIFIYMYVCVYIYTYIYINVDTRIYVCTCICFESVWTWVTHMHIYISVRVCVCSCMCMYTYTHICMRSTYIYMYT